TDQLDRGGTQACEHRGAGHEVRRPSTREGAHGVDERPGHDRVLQPVVEVRDRVPPLAVAEEERGDVAVGRPALVEQVLVEGDLVTWARVVEHRPAERDPESHQGDADDDRARRRADQSGHGTAQTMAATPGPDVGAWAGAAATVDAARS